MKKLDESVVKKMLEPHLLDEEIDALLKRRELLIDKIEQLTGEK